jgi:hypothetical protein
VPSARILERCVELDIPVEQSRGLPENKLLPPLLLRERARGERHRLSSPI